MIRIASGFVFAPILGVLLYFIAISFSSPFSFNTLIPTVSHSLIYFLSVTVIASPLFYPIAMIMGTVVLLLLMRYYSHNIGICILGALTNGMLVSMLFFIMLLLSGAAFMPALAGFALLLSMITVPSILAGILFWFIVVFRNAFLRPFLEMNIN